MQIDSRPAGRGRDTAQTDGEKQIKIKLRKKQSRLGMVHSPSRRETGGGAEYGGWLHAKTHYESGCVGVGVGVIIPSSFQHIDRDAFLIWAITLRTLPQPNCIAVFQPQTPFHQIVSDSNRRFNPSLSDRCSIVERNVRLRARSGSIY